MAEKAGMITPLYTVTVWGNAAVIDNEAIPVTAAYTYPFWAKPSMSPFCLFKDIQHNPDYSPLNKKAPFISMGGIPISVFPKFDNQTNVLSIDKVELVPEYRIEVKW